MTEHKTIDVSDLKPNSFKEKEKKKQPVNKVVQKEVKHHKETMGERFEKVFLSGSVENVQSYVIFDVMIPALKDMAFDMIEKGLKMILFDEGTPSHISRGRSYDTGKYVSYQSYSQRPSHRTSGTQYVRPTANDFSDIIFRDRIDAEHVLDGLIELIDRYEVASVADFKKFSGLRTSYTDENVGWANLSSAQVARTREGYIIKLPRPISLEEGPVEYGEVPF